MAEIVSTLCVSLFVLHELDAVHRHEWRVFPLIRRLPDEVGFTVFVTLHLPIFLLIFWLETFSTPEVARAFYIFLGTF